jgi:hypothetical protein
MSVSGVPHPSAGCSHPSRSLPREGWETIEPKMFAFHIISFLPRTMVRSVRHEGMEPLPPNHAIESD